MLFEAIVGFLCCALAIRFSGTHLARLGDRLAELTGLGRAWLGLVLMATVTSLPELFVGIGSAGIQGNADLAVGDVLGSNLFNIVILTIDDLVYSGGFLLKDASDAHLVSVLSTIIMSAIVIVGLTFHTAPKRYLLAWDTFLFLLVYVINLVLLYRIA